MTGRADATRLPGLDLLRALGALWLFHLVFFAGGAELAARLAQGPEPLDRAAARVVGLLASSGVTGLETLLAVAGFLAFRDIAQGRARAVLSRFLRLAAPLAVLNLAHTAYAKGLPGLMLLDTLLLRSQYSMPLLERAVDGFNPFLAFLPLAWAWARLAGRFPAAASWPALAAAWAACAALVLAGPPGWTPNAHFLAFFWGAAAAKLSERTAWPARVPAWTGPACFLAAVALCHKLSAARGADAAYLIAGRTPAALAQATALQALCALAAACSLKPWTAPAWARPVLLAGSATYGFFIAWTHWSFPLTAGLGGGPLALRYAAALGVSVFAALVLKPCLDRLPR